MNKHLDALHRPSDDDVPLFAVEVRTQRDTDLMVRNLTMHSDSGSPQISAMCATMSPVVSPLACSADTRAPDHNKRRQRFGATTDLTRTTPGPSQRLCVLALRQKAVPKRPKPAAMRPVSWALSGWRGEPPDAHMLNQQLRGGPGAVNKL